MPGDGARIAWDMRNRAGFTLVETIVALVLLQVAMLALAAGAAVAAREVAHARRIRVARMTAGNRVDELASSSCPAPVTGAAAGHGFVEHWRVDAQGDRRLISDSVVIARRNGTFIALVARRTTLCEP